MSSTTAAANTSSVSPLSDVQYDMVAAAHNILEGITALEQYRNDAIEAGDTRRQSLFENILGKYVEAWGLFEAYDSETCGGPAARGPHLTGCH